MTINVRAIYERGMLGLKEPLPLPDGAAVDVIVTSREATDTGSRVKEDRSWDMLIQLWLSTRSTREFRTSLSTTITTCTAFQKSDDRNNAGA